MDLPCAGFWAGMIIVEMGLHNEGKKVFLVTAKTGELELMSLSN